MTRYRVSKEKKKFKGGFTVQTSIDNMNVYINNYKDVKSLDDNGYYYDQTFKDILSEYGDSPFGYFYNNNYNKITAQWKTFVNVIPKNELDIATSTELYLVATNFGKDPLNINDQKYGKLIKAYMDDDLKFLIDANLNSYVFPSGMFKEYLNTYANKMDVNGYHPIVKNDIFYGIFDIAGYNPFGFDINGNDFTNNEQNHNMFINYIYWIISDIGGTFLSDIRNVNKKYDNEIKNNISNDLKDWLDGKNELNNYCMHIIENKTGKSFNKNIKWGELDNIIKNNPTDSAVGFTYINQLNQNVDQNLIRLKKEDDEKKIKKINKKHDDLADIYNDFMKKYNIYQYPAFPLFRNYDDISSDKIDELDKNYIDLINSYKTLADAKNIYPDIDISQINNKIISSDFFPIINDDIKLEITELLKKANELRHKKYIDDINQYIDTITKNKRYKIKQIDLTQKTDDELKKISKIFELKLKIINTTVIPDDDLENFNNADDLDAIKAIGTYLADNTDDVGSKLELLKGLLHDEINLGYIGKELEKNLITINFAKYNPNSNNDILKKKALVNFEDDQKILFEKLIRSKFYYSGNNDVRIIHNGLIIINTMNFDDIKSEQELYQKMIETLRLSGKFKTEIEDIRNGCAKSQFKNYINIFQKSYKIIETNYNYAKDICDIFKNSSFSLTTECTKLESGEKISNDNLNNAINAWIINSLKKFNPNADIKMPMNNNAKEYYGILRSKTQELVTSILSMATESQNRHEANKKNIKIDDKYKTKQDEVTKYINIGNDQMIKLKEDLAEFNDTFKKFKFTMQNDIIVFDEWKDDNIVEDIKYIVNMHNFFIRLFEITEKVKLIFNYITGDIEKTVNELNKKYKSIDNHNKAIFDKKSQIDKRATTKSKLTLFGVIGLCVLITTLVIVFAAIAIVFFFVIWITFALLLFIRMKRHGKGTLYSLFLSAIPITNMSYYLYTLWAWQ